MYRRTIHDETSLEVVVGTGLLHVSHLLVAQRHVQRGLGGLTGPKNPACPLEPFSLSSTLRPVQHGRLLVEYTTVGIALEIFEEHMPPQPTR